jgi:PAS domain-containing protein
VAESIVRARAVVRVPDSDPIKYLVLRRFPFATAIRYPPSLSGGRGIDLEDRQRSLSEIRAYEEELRKKGRAELQALCDEERAKQKAELLDQAKREELARFFNQPDANADFSHWSKAAHWTLDEAIALSFGKAPERVSWEKVKPFVKVSPFAFQYERRRDLALRAKTWEQLFDPVLPGIFLAWAKRTEIPVSPVLEATVTARGVQIADWKTLYDQLNAKCDEEREQWSAKYRELANAANEVIAERDAAERALVESKALEKGLGTKERESLLRLVIGMAIEGYRYDPNQRRSDKTTEIVTDLEKVGLPLDADTVRKWLREATEILPAREAE